MKAHNNSEILDSKLASESQQAIRKIVQDLPEETLSMAWRSSLNERLLAEPVLRRPRFRFSWIAMPAAGVAVACGLAVAVFFHTPETTLPQAQAIHGNGNVSGNGLVENGLLEAYRQDSVTREIEGAGPDPSVDGVHPSLVDVASDSNNSEVDPDSL